MSGYHIRPASKEDFLLLMAIYEHAVTRHNPSADPGIVGVDAFSEAKEGMDDIRKGIGNTLVLFDETSQTIQAYLSYREKSTGERYLRRLYTEQSEHHYGLKLYRYFIEDCKEKGVSAIITTPEPYVRKFAERFGFRPITPQEGGADKEEWGAQGAPMVLKLTS
jgi:L-amino acid N-acyltransferase YncA